METLKSLIKMGHKTIKIKDNERELKVDLYTPREFFKRDEIQNEERTNGKTGIVLLHGLGANPRIVYNMLRKGNFLDHFLFVPQIDSITESNEEHMLRQASVDITLFIKEAKKYCDHIFVFGHSLGGYLTAFSLQKATKEDIEGICLIGAPYSFREVIFKLGLNLLGFVGKRIENLKPIIKQLEKEIPGLSYHRLEQRLYFQKFKFKDVDGIRDLFNAPNLLEASTPEVPIILLHGIDDEVISYSHAVLLYQKFRKSNKDVELNLIPFTGHHLEGMEKESMDKVREWMQKIIRGYTK